jgi:hypothetical protein
MKDTEIIIKQIVQSAQQVDPAVSKAKFEREVSIFKKVEEYNNQRGVFLLRTQFPFIVLAFAAYRIRPLAFVFAVRLDFTNYDLEAPSLKFVDPLTEGEVTIEQLYTHFLRAENLPSIQLPSAQLPLQHKALAQAHPPKNIPFFCIPGIREYHEHPFHTNDPWLSHRGKGEGTLGFIIDQLHKYGTEPIDGLMPNGVAISQVNPAAMLVQFQGCKFSIDKIPT